MKSVAQRLEIKFDLKPADIYKYSIIGGGFFIALVAAKLLGVTQHLKSYQSMPAIFFFIYSGYFFGITILVLLLARRLVKERNELNQAKMEVEKKVSQLQYFYDFTKKTTTLRNIESLSQYFVEQFTFVLNAKKCALYLAHNDCFLLSKSYGYKAEKKLELSEDTLKELEDNKLTRLYVKNGKIREIFDLYGWMFYIPLKINDKLIGFIICQDEKDTSFNNENVSLVRALTPQVSALIYSSTSFKQIMESEIQAEKNAHYLNKSRSAVLNILEDFSVINKKLETAVGQTKSMYKVSVDLSRSIEQEKLLDLILKNAMELVNAGSGVVMLKNKDHLLPYKEVNINLKVEHASPCEKAYETGVPFVDNNIKKHFKKFADCNPNIKNTIAIPLVQGKRIVGSVSLFNKPRDFNEKDKELLVTLANQAAISLLNSQIFQREKETVKKLKDIDKLKDDFVASVSHELKTPLTAIKGYLEILMEEEAGYLNDQQHEFLNIINQSTEKLHNLITDLLDYSKIESNTLVLYKTKTDLPLLLKRSIALVKPEMEKKHLDLTTNIKEGLPFVEVDGNRIEQVMLNFLTNAVKFTDEKGKIEIDCWYEDGSIIISVADSGMGISKEDQKNLFKKFFRSSTAISRRTPGTGLGLAVSKGIIEQHGGKVWIRSEIKKGSTFYFSLPIKERTDNRWINSENGEYRKG